MRTDSRVFGVDPGKCESARATSAISAAIASALGVSTSISAEIAAQSATPESGHRATRRTLWELPPKHHCVLVGAAFNAQDLRQMFRRARYSEWRKASEYELHSSAVCFSKDRNAFSQLAQRLLERKFADSAARLASASTTSELQKGWRNLAMHGDAVGAYWAALTHPRCDAELDECLSREMHVIAHDEFSARRAAMRQIQKLHEQISSLEAKQEELREKMDAHRKLNADLSDRLRDSQAEMNDARSELERWRSGDIALRQRECHAALEHSLAASRAETDAANRALRGALRRLERNENSARATVARVGNPHEPLVPRSELDPLAAPPDLGGRRVLCVGGKATLVPHYRAIVEGACGKFNHHDGGLEHHVKRLSAMLAAADAVVCLTGDCSHAAYRLAKRYCKANGKICALLGNSSATALARCIAGHPDLANR